MLTQHAIWKSPDNDARVTHDKRPLCSAWLVVLIKGMIINDSNRILVDVMTSKSGCAYLLAKVVSGAHPGTNHESMVCLHQQQGYRSRQEHRHSSETDHSRTHY